MRPSRQTFAGSAFAALAVWLAVFQATAGEPDNSISLSGTWRFRLDPAGVGITNQWFKQTLEDSVHPARHNRHQPERHFQDERAVDRLSRVWY